MIVFLEDNDAIDYLKIPSICLDLLQVMATSNVLNEINFSRMNSFRNSLRRLSSQFTNRLSPSSAAGGRFIHKNRIRSVTFNDVPVVYNISGH